MFFFTRSSVPDTCCLLFRAMLLSHLVNKCRIFPPTAQQFWVFFASALFGCWQEVGKETVFLLLLLPLLLFLLGGGNMQFNSTGQKYVVAFVSLVSASTLQRAAVCHCRSLDVFVFFYSPQLNWVVGLKISEPPSRVLPCEALERTAAAVVKYPGHRAA